MILAKGTTGTDSKPDLARYQHARGETARVTRDVFAVTGHPPSSMIQFGYDYRRRFAEHNAVPTTERSELVPQ